MNREEIEADLPLIEFYYEEVLKCFERIRTKAARKVSRKDVIDRFMATRDFRGTAREFGVSVSLVYHILHKASRFAREYARLRPKRRDLWDR